MAAASAEERRCRAASVGWCTGSRWWVAGPLNGRLVPRGEEIVSWFAGGGVGIACGFVCYLDDYGFGISVKVLRCHMFMLIFRTYCFASAALLLDNSSLYFVAAFEVYFVFGSLLAKAAEPP